MPCAVTSMNYSPEFSESGHEKLPSPHDKCQNTAFRGINVKITFHHSIE